MNLLNLSITSIVDATTGSHLAQTSYSAHRPGNSKPAFVESQPSRTGLLRTGYEAISSLASKLIAAYRKSAQRRKDTAHILSLSPNALKDIGLTAHDLIDLKLGQVSLDSLNARRFSNHEVFKVRVTKAGTSKLETADVRAANQCSSELASCA